MSIATHQAQFRLYYLRKTKEGKPKQLVMNNFTHKLIDIMVAVVRTRTRFIPNDHSINPGLLKLALTKS